MNTNTAATQAVAASTFALNGRIVDFSAVIETHEAACAAGLSYFGSDWENSSHFDQCLAERIDQAHESGEMWVCVRDWHESSRQWEDSYYFM